MTSRMLINLRQSLLKWRRIHCRIGAPPLQAQAESPDLNRTEADAPPPRRARQVAGNRFEHVGLLRGAHRQAPVVNVQRLAVRRALYNRTITSPASSSTGLTVSRLTIATATTRTAGEKYG